MPVSIMWFRRDLRLADNPALLNAAADGEVLPVFVLDRRLWEPSGLPRRAFLAGCLRELSARTDGRLAVLEGRPEEVLPAVAARSGAVSVHAAADFGPYGAARDERVAAALDVPLVFTGSPYAVAPGRIRTGDGGPYKVFTPYHRAWLGHGWRRPAGPADDVRWSGAAPSEGLPDATAGADIPEPGEEAALARWAAYLKDGLIAYEDVRNRPDLDATSRMSAYLRWGCVHPRTLLADIPAGADTFRKELAWREFYADVLHHRPASARRELQPRLERMRWDADPDLLAAWAEGRTGYPIVDAGMRQLLAEGWMHNRVRMITASFLIKDLHLDWRLGARHFMRHLVDGDLASNQHGWQWTAGTGTDAAPFHRVFNPVRQGLTYDPAGDYVRRYVPELAGLAGAAAHEPWDAPAAARRGYPDRVVDHAEQRAEALRRYQEATR